MILYGSGFLTLHYDPSTDILTVDMPPVDDILLPEINRSFGIIVEHVRNYDIKKLLVDARKTQVDVQEDAFSTVFSEYVCALASTRLQKLARLVSPSTIKEEIVDRVFQGKGHTLQYQSFTEIEPAILWLNQ